jgi:protein-disulfide isomerase
MSMHRAAQRGVTLTGLLLTGIVVALVAVVGMKVVPDVIEYGKVMKNIKAVSQDASLKGASVADVRKAYERRSIVDQIDAVTPQDIDVSKDGNNLVLSFSYSKRIPLFGPVSLVIDFEGSTGQ